MGNCQAIDAAALVIQHPNGKLERLYWPVTASEIMSLNPGHYVSLIIPLPLSDSQHPQDADQPIHQNTVRFTRVKLLRPTDTLALGHAYRLITSQEVMKVLRAKKYAKIKRQQQQQQDSIDTSASDTQKLPTKEDNPQKLEGTKNETHRPRSSSSTNLAVSRSKSWRPSLQSISEAAS